MRRCYGENTARPTWGQFKGKSPPFPATHLWEGGRLRESTHRSKRCITTHVGRGVRIPRPPGSWARQRPRGAPPSTALPRARLTDVPPPPRSAETQLTCDPVRVQGYAVTVWVLTGSRISSERGTWKRKFTSVISQRSRAFSCVRTWKLCPS